MNNMNIEDITSTLNKYLARYIILLLKQDILCK